MVILQAVEKIKQVFVEKWRSEPEQSLLKCFTPSAVHTGRTVQSSQILSLYIYQLRPYTFALL
jgi:hypothetical protein